MMKRRAWLIWSALGCQACLDPVCWETKTCVPWPPDAGTLSPEEGGLADSGREAGDAADSPTTLVTTASSAPHTHDSADASGNEPGVDASVDSADSASSSGSATPSTSAESIAPRDSGVPPLADTGVAQVGCKTGEVQCNGLCVNPVTDSDYCGASEACEDPGAVCLDGKQCVLGTCRGWEEPELLASNLALGLGAAAFNPEGDDAFAVWIDSNNRTFGQRFDGTTWLGTIQLQTDVHSDGDIKVSTRGGIAVAIWTDEYEEIRRVTRWNGSSWSAPQETNLATRALVGNTWQSIVWSAACVDDSETRCLHFADWQGTDWVETDVEAMGSSGSFSLTTDGDTGLVAWIDSSDQDGDSSTLEPAHLTVGLRQEGQWHFQQIAEASSSDSVDGAGYGAAISGDHAVVAWYTSRPNNKQGIAASVWDGASWSRSEQLSDNPELTIRNRTPIGAIVDNTALVAWQEPGVGPTGDSVLTAQARAWEGSGWGEVRRLSPNDGGDVAFLRMAGSGDSAVAAWTESRTVDSAKVSTVYAAVWKDSSWLPAAPMSGFEIQGVSEPDVAAAGETAIVAWGQQATEGTFQAYATRWDGSWEPAVEVSGTSPKVFSVSAQLSNDGSRALVTARSSELWVSRFW